jgi:cell division protein FtsL
MRPVFWYMLLALSVAFCGMFFVSQHSRQVQIGYELTSLRRTRDAELERARKLVIEIEKAASHDALLQSARRLGLTLQGPVQRD